MNEAVKGTPKKQTRAANTSSRESSPSQVNVKFQTKAPDGSNVFLAGSFNNWEPKAIALKKNGDGLYSAVVPLPQGRHEYKFVINGSWKVDEHCQQRVPNACGSFNSIIDVK